jgi:hypothetical protein
MAMGVENMGKMAGEMVEGVIFAAFVVMVVIAWSVMP